MRPALRNLAMLCGLLVVYYAIPVGRRPSAVGAILGVLGVVGGGAVLAVLITRQVRQQLRAGEEQAVQVQSLLVLIYLTVTLFSLGYLSWRTPPTTSSSVWRPRPTPSTSGDHPGHRRVRRRRRHRIGRPGAGHGPDRVQPGLRGHAGLDGHRPSAPAGRFRPSHHRVRCPRGRRTSPVGARSPGRADLASRRPGSTVESQRRRRGGPKP